MMEKFPKSYPTQEALAKHVGIAQNTISQRIRDYEDTIRYGTAQKQHYPRGDNGLLEPSCEDSFFPCLPRQTWVFSAFSSKVIVSS